MVETKLFIATLNAICADVAARYEYIDSGGCGLCAVTFAEVLRECGFNPRYKIVVLDDPDDPPPEQTIAQIRQDMRRYKLKPKADWGNWAEGGLDMYHIVTTFKLNGRRYGVDVTNGCKLITKNMRWDDKSLVFARGFFDNGDMDELVSKDIDWNYKFRYNHDPKEVRQTLRKKLRTLRELFV